MPPLLPEYLSQPIQVVVESPDTDWLALLAAGVFTLVGAGLGAWLGGRAAYKNTVKAQNAAIKRHKIEEALSIIIDIEEPMRILHSIVHEPIGLKNGTDAFVIKVGDLTAQVTSKNSPKLVALLEVYEPNLKLSAMGLSTAISAMATQVSFAKAVNVKHLDILTTTASCHSQLSYLKEELINALKF